MALKLRLVEGDILDADAAFVEHDVAHLVDQQEGIAMRNDPLDQIEIGLLRGGGVGHRCLLAGDRVESEYQGNRCAASLGWPEQGMRQVRQGAIATYPARFPTALA